MRYKINQKEMRRRMSKGLPLLVKLRGIFYGIKYRKIARRFSMRDFK